MPVFHDHTFAVCAYKESPYLEDCIQSLKAQKVRSNIIIITSTPNMFIENIAKKYKVPYIINTGEGGITQDWNFAYAQAGTKYITITHQDDVYQEDYLSEAIKLMGKAKKPLIFFSDYFEIRGGQRVEKNRLLTVKRMMLVPLRIRAFQRSRWVRRRILSFGTPICCPSVMFASENLPKIVFQNRFRACEDWEAWEIISRLSGSFVYCTRMLVGHRIHAESETSAIIGDNKRTEEEYQMYCKFWPPRLARFWAGLYAKSQDSNEL